MPADSFVSKFDLGGTQITVKDDVARQTANSAATNATNAINKVAELEKLSRVVVTYSPDAETITISTSDHTK